MMWSIPKNKNSILFLIPCLFLMLCFLTGCGDETPPPTKPAVVEKHIQQTAPKTAVTEAKKPASDAQKEAPAEGTAAQVTGTAPVTVVPGTDQKETASTPSAKTQANAASAPQPVETKETTPQPEASNQVSLKKSLLDETIPRYDPTGRIDPFAALFSNEANQEAAASTIPKRPLTPLEKIDISQLKLVAVLMAKSGNRAMVEDVTGKPYILKPGTYIGVNSGTVTKIEKDRVVIEEKTKDFLGRETSSTRELKLQKPLGEE